MGAPLFVAVLLCLVLAAAAVQQPTLPSSSAANSSTGVNSNSVLVALLDSHYTEESMYNAVRRFGTVRYDTLRLPQKVTAREADGSVKFGHGEGSAYLFDPDIYTDGRISVQGIDAVLFPPVEDTAKSAGASPVRKALVVTGTAKPKLRRGKLLEGACHVAAVFGGRSHFKSCQ
ncbi:unnamed protein product [Triticum turgidum subsp. durum]|uniref:Dolichyl-diphosphooligosaccharide--protein glycosyltransferase 48 kDa subunit n=1 Tax=Triticum turgidum subsp. durum TaxID=4567 RepID=A0A9R1NSZ2_TRITD|nr:unnamed protein product [Triticum turgidum subsp. durum]